MPERRIDLAAIVDDSQVERDVVTVRAQLDYPKRGHAEYIAALALEALDRLARKAHEADQLILNGSIVGVLLLGAGAGLRRWAA